MGKLTAEEKAENARERIIDRLKCLRINKAKNEVAREFQLMIRLEYAADNDGILRCCTCPKTGRLGENSFDAGHFIPGRRASLIFDERNINVQCKSCNDHFGGRPDRYESFMLGMYGEDVIEELRAKGRRDEKFTHEQLADLLIGFRARIKAAKEKLDGTQ